MRVYSVAQIREGVRCLDHQDLDRLIMLVEGGETSGV